MNRWFNTAGPCQPKMHYMLPSMPRLPQLETLIDRAGYFVLHAPRQVGKTTAMLTIAQELTAQGKYTAVMASLSFWRQYGEPLLNSAAYHEIAPHLVLMAFLHRVVNGSTSSPRRGGGSLEREYAIGSDRMDLFLRYGAVRLGIELKVWRQTRPDPLTAGLQKLDGYLARLGLDWGWLVIFDRRNDLVEIADRTTTEMAVTANGRSITVIRG